jgi:hypothetical protein
MTEEANLLNLIMKLTLKIKKYNLINSVILKIKRNILLEVFIFKNILFKKKNSSHVLKEKF